MACKYPTVETRRGHISKDNDEYTQSACGIDVTLRHAQKERTQISQTSPLSEGSNTSPWGHPRLPLVDLFKNDE